jgi:hypothetical protein
MSWVLSGDRECLGLVEKVKSGVSGEWSLFIVRFGPCDYVSALSAN